MANVMPFEKFEYIIQQILEHEAKRERISDFIEEEFCTDSYCFFTVGDKLQETLVNLLADEFNCWYKVDYNTNVDKLKESLGIETEKLEDKETPVWWDKSVRKWENDIEYWLYEDAKKIEIDGEEIPIGTVKEFYDYLIKYCVDKK